MKYRIQQKQAAELQACRELFCAGRDAADTQPAAEGIEQAAFCFAAEADGETIGAAWAWGLEDDTRPAETYVFVMPACRSRGIGTELVRTLTDYLALCGYPELFATVRRDNYAVLLFGRVGFRPVREVDEVYTLRCDLKSVGQISLS